MAAAIVHRRRMEQALVNSPPPRFVDLTKPVVTANLVSPTQHRVVIGALLAGINVNVVPETSAVLATVAYHQESGKASSKAEGAAAGLMLLLRRSSSPDALDALVRGETEGPAQMPLCPAGNADFARAQELVAATDALIAQITARAAAEVKDIPAAKLRVAAATKALEALVSEEGPYAVGTEPTFADAAIVPAVARLLLVTMGAGLDGAPRLWRVYEHACCTVDGVSETLEDNAFDLDAFETFAQSPAASISPRSQPIMVRAG